MNRSGQKDTRIMLLKLRSFAGFFQRINEHAGNVTTRLLHDLLKAGRAGHVDFSEVIADHIQSYQ